MKKMHYYLSKKYLSKKWLGILAFALLFPITSAQANPIDTQDFLPNCNILELHLSPMQSTHLRRLRLEYRLAMEQAVAQDSHAAHQRHQYIRRILTASDFDENQAIRYVDKRFQASQEFAVKELEIQYKFHQMLNKTQRKIWLENCVK